MNLPLFFSLLATLGFTQLWIGKKAGSSVNDKDDYFLMGRKLGLFSLVMTVLATQIGGGALMGAAEEAYTYGWKVLFYPLGMVLGMLMLGFGFGAKFRALNIGTIAELFEAVYRSKLLRRGAALLSIASLSFILVAQAIAARKFFISLGFSAPWLFIGLWMILVLYTTFGGLKAVVKTDILQVGFILAAFIATAFFAQPLAMPVVTEPASSPPLLTWLFMPLLFMLIEQDMGQRCFAAKSKKVVSLAFVMAALSLFATALLPIYFGVHGRGLEIPAGGSVLITAVQSFCNPAILTLLITAILMAIVSTADSLLCSISSNLACDFLGNKSSLALCRTLTFVLGMGTLVLSFFFNNVVSVLMFSYKLSIAMLFVPVMLALILKKPSKMGAYGAMIAGGILLVFMPIGWTLVGSTVAYFIMSSYENRRQSHA